MKDRLQNKINLIIHSSFVIQNLMEILDRYFELEGRTCEQITYIQDLHRFILKKHRKIIRKIDSLILDL